MPSLLVLQIQHDLRLSQIVNSFIASIATRDPCISRPSEIRRFTNIFGIDHSFCSSHILA